MADDSDIVKLHHIGIVVPDLDRAMTEMSRLLGIRWTPPQERPDNGRTLRVAFSLSTPRIELIQGNPGGTWSTSDGPKLDHMAFWIGDFDATAKRADDLGLVREAGGRAAWGGQWSYVRTAQSGARIELCDEKGREYFGRQWGFAEEQGNPAPAAQGD